MRVEQLDMFGGAIAEEKYQAFEEKFQPKKTTDDCYTPANIYDAIADWVAAEYGVDRARFLRPFHPDGDYVREEYPDGCVVVDNPPFSILAEIEKFYIARGVRFFLFAPAMTCLSGVAAEKLCVVAAYGDITYENGASVKTSFVTNLDGCAMRTAPALTREINRINRINEKAKHAQLPKYAYPDHVVTTAMAGRWSQYGVEWRLERKDCRRIGALDAQRSLSKSIFGYGYLLSERAAAERAAAVKWELSDRERDLVRSLG